MPKTITEKQVVFIEDLATELDLRIKGDQSELADLIVPTCTHFIKSVTNKTIEQLSCSEASVIIDMLEYLKYNRNRTEIVNKFTTDEAAEIASDDLI